MDFAQLISDAATETEGILAQMQGMEEGATGNFMYQNSTFVGVFGQATIEELPLPEGGYRRRSVVPLTVTRAQTNFIPTAKEKLIRLCPQITYTVDKFDANDRLLWTLMLIKVGA